MIGSILCPQFLCMFVSVCVRGRTMGKNGGSIVGEAVGSRVWKQSQRSQIHVWSEFGERDNGAGKRTIEQDIIWTLVPSFPPGGNRALFWRGPEAILNSSNASWCIRTRNQASHSFSRATSFLFPLPFLYWVTMMVLWRSFRTPVAWEVQSPWAGSPQSAKGQPGARTDPTGRHVWVREDDGEAGDVRRSEHMAQTVVFPSCSVPAEEG